jgi:hypothetical protein
MRRYPRAFNIYDESGNVSEAHEHKLSLDDFLFEVLINLANPKKAGARNSASGKKRSLDFYRDLLSASFAWYSATMRCNSCRTKLERLRYCLAASSSIASKISLGTLLIVSI